ncbi:hypothetical protein [Thiolinea disciformis]|uniref:hypothetical protein n=1 Tax=Thiolinea disciformis TaxID=125614 RepID=UPI00036EB28F|nr:hypothetical protein [Thiolinea disciformis]
MSMLSNYDRELIIKRAVALGDFKLTYNKQHKIWSVKNQFNETLSSSAVNAHEALKAAALLEYQKQQQFLATYSHLWLAA